LMKLARKFLEHDLPPVFGFALWSTQKNPSTRFIEKAGEVFFEVAQEFSSHGISAEMHYVFWDNKLYDIYRSESLKEYKRAVEEQLRLCLLVQEKGLNLEAFLDEYNGLLKVEREHRFLALTPKQCKTVNEIVYSWVEEERPYSAIIQGLKLIVEYGIGDSPARIRKFADRYKALYENTSEAFSLETFFDSFAKSELRQHVKNIDDIVSLLEVAQKFDGLGINQRTLFAGFTAFSARIKKLGFQRVADGLFMLASTCSKSSRVNFDYFVQNTSGDVLKAINFEDINKLLHEGIYPTDYIAGRYSRLPQDQRGRYIQVLSQKLKKMYQTEEVDLHDPESVELYHRYLGIPIALSKFKKILADYMHIQFGRIKSFFRSFTVNASGVRLNTNEVDLALVDRLVDKSTGFDLFAFITNFFEKKVPISPECYSRLLFSICGLFQDMDEIRNLRKRIHDKNVLFTTSQTLKNTNDPLRLLTLMFCLPVLMRVMKNNKKLEEDTEIATRYKEVIFKNRSDAQALYDESKKAILSSSRSLLDGILNKNIILINSHIFETLIAYQQTMERIRQFEDDPELNRAILSQQKLLQDALRKLLLPYVHEKMRDPDQRIQRDILRTLIRTLERESLTNPKVRSILAPLYEASIFEASPELLDDLFSDAVDVKLNALRVLYKERIPNLRERTQNEIVDFIRMGVRKQVMGLPKKLKNESAKKGINSIYGKIQAVLKNRSLDLSAETLSGLREIQGKTTSLLSVSGSNGFNWDLLRDLSCELEYYLDQAGSDFTTNLSVSLEAEISFIFNQVDAVRELEEGIEPLIERINEEKTVYGLVSLLQNEIRENKKIIQDRLGDDEIDSLKRKIGKIEAERDQKLEELPKGKAGRSERKALNKMYREKINPLENSLKKLTQYPAFLSSLNTILADYVDQTALTDSSAQQTIYAIESELAKVEERILPAKTFYLVPSHSPGDIFKGWVSGDCTTGYLDQFLNQDFTNYRIYRSGDDGQKKWVGNVYILEAYYGGSRVLVIDVIQPQKKLDISHEDFVRGVVDGFREMLGAGDFDYLLMNDPKTASGLFGTVSNRREVRAAYIKLYGGIKEKVGPGQVTMRDKHGSFQSINNGRFNILWKHEELRTMDQDEFFEEIERYNGPDARRFLEAAKARSPRSFERKHQNRRKLDALLKYPAAAFSILARNLDRGEKIENIIFDKSFLGILARLGQVLKDKSLDSESMVDALIASIADLPVVSLNDNIVSVSSLLREINAAEPSVLTNYVWPQMERAEYKKARIILRSGEDNLSELAGLLGQFQESELDTSETTDSLQNKLFERRFKGSGLTPPKSLRNIFLSGESALFYMSGNERYLPFFAADSLSELKRAHKGLDPKDFREDDEEESEEEKKVGYSDLYDFIEDQRNILDQKGHQQPCGEPGGLGMGLHWTPRLVLQQRQELRMSLQLKQTLVDQLEMRLAAIDDPDKVKFFRIADTDQRTIKIVSKRLGPPGSKGVYQEIQNLLDLQEREIPGVLLPEIFGIAESQRTAYLLMHHVPNAVTLVDLIQRRKSLYELCQRNKTRLSSQELRFLLSEKPSEERGDILRGFLNKTAKRKYAGVIEALEENGKAGDWFSFIIDNNLALATSLPQDLFEEYQALKTTQITAQLGSLVATLHKEGVEFNGLAPRNIMIRLGDEIEFILLDHEDTKVHDKPLSDDERRKNLVDFGEEIGVFVRNPELSAVFMRAYLREMDGKFDRLKFPRTMLDLSKIYKDDKKHKKTRGLSAAQYSLLERIIEELAKDPNLNQSEIGENLKIEGTTISRVMSKKVSREIIEECKKSGEIPPNQRERIEEIIVELKMGDPKISAPRMTEILEERNYDVARRTVSKYYNELKKSGRFDEIRVRLEQAEVAAEVKDIAPAPVASDRFWFTPQRAYLENDSVEPVLDKMDPGLRTRYLSADTRVRRTQATERLFSVLRDHDTVHAFNQTQEYYTTFKERTRELGLEEDFDRPGQEYGFTLNGEIEPEEDVLLLGSGTSEILSAQVTALGDRKQESKLDLPQLVELLEQQRAVLIERIEVKADAADLLREYVNNLLLLITMSGRTWDDLLTAYEQNRQMDCLLKLEELYRDNLGNELINREDNLDLREGLKNELRERTAIVSEMTRRSVVEDAHEEGEGVGVNNYRMVLSAKDADELARGGISSDCTDIRSDFAFHETVPQHFFDPGFLSFRLYENNDWVGNVYLLVEESEGEPVLVIDAIQFQTNHRYLASRGAILDNIIEQMQNYSEEHGFSELDMSKFISNRSSNYYYLDGRYPERLLEVEKVGGFRHLRDLALWNSSSWRNEYLETNSPGNPNAERQVLPLRLIWRAEEEIEIVEVDPQALLAQREAALPVPESLPATSPAPVPGPLPQRVQTRAEVLLNNPQVSSEQRIFLNFVYESLLEARGADDEEVRDALHHVYQMMQSEGGRVPPNFVLGVDNMETGQVVEIRGRRVGNRWQREIGEGQRR
ncbi:MAG: hypothetical protein HQ564_00485, partial [Candidatus Saganbacteria bacterium]|nr:hypothetical protein [Candidatus Saganbacteria bacterium]